MSGQLSLAHPAWFTLPHLCSVQCVHSKPRWISKHREGEELNEIKGKLERERKERGKRRLIKEMLKTLPRDK